MNGLKGRCHHLKLGSDMTGQPLQLSCLFPPRQLQLHSNRSPSACSVMSFAPPQLRVSAEPFHQPPYSSARASVQKRSTLRPAGRLGPGGFRPEGLPLPPGPARPSAPDRRRRSRPGRAEVFQSGRRGNGAAQQRTVGAEKVSVGEGPQGGGSGQRGRPGFGGRSSALRRSLPPSLGQNLFRTQDRQHLLAAPTDRLTQ